MDEIVSALADQQAELAALLAPLDESEWQHASRCEGWTVADVVLHVAQTNEMAIASARGRFSEFLNEIASDLGPASDVDAGADLMVARDRGQPGGAIRDRWRASAHAQSQALRALDPHQRVQWVAGELSVQTLATTRLAETWIHSGDVAAAFGTQLAPTDRLRPIARLAWRTLPYAFARAGKELAGPVALELRGPRGDPWDFTPDAEPCTIIRGDALDFCMVAARRVDPRDTTLRGDGPDVDAILELVRTYA